MENAALDAAKKRLTPARLARLEDEAELSQHPVFCRTRAPQSDLFIADEADELMIAA